MKSSTRKTRGTARKRKPENEPSPSIPFASEPEEEPAEPDQPDDPNDFDPDDQQWDAFLADDDERDPQPDHGDFWFED